MNSYEKKTISKKPFFILITCLAIIAVCVIFPIIFYSYNISSSELYVKIGDELKSINDVNEYKSIQAGDSIYFEIKNNNIIRAFFTFKLEFICKDKTKPTKEQLDYLDYVTNEIVYHTAEESINIKKQNNSYCLSNQEDKVIPLNKKRSIMIRAFFPLSLENRLSSMPDFYISIKINKSFFGSVYY